MRPKPLTPTRTVTVDLPAGGVSATTLPGVGAAFEPSRSLWTGPWPASPRGRSGMAAAWLRDLYPTRRWTPRAKSANRATRIATPGHWTPTSRRCWGHCGPPGSPRRRRTRARSRRCPRPRRTANPTRSTPCSANRTPEGKTSGGEHLGRDGGLGVGDAEVGGPLVGQREQPPDPPGDRVLGHRRRGELAELLKRGLLVLQPQPPGLGQVLGQVVTEDLQGPLHPGAGRHRGPGRPPQVGVVEVGQPVRGRPHLAAHPPLLPGQHALVRAEPG